MTRNLKTLGLALVAVFALSAVVASAASAQQGTLTSDGPVIQTAPETGEKQNWAEIFGAKVECPGSSFHGYKVATTPHVPIPSGATEATLVPTFLETVGGKPNCVLPGVGLTMTMDMNGCDFVVKSGETTGGVNTYGATLSLVCPANKQVAITLFTGAHANPPFCSIDLPGAPSNQNLTGLHVTDTTNGTLDLQGVVTGITATKTKTGAGVLCPHEATNTAKMSIDGTVIGENAGGSSTAITLSHS